SYYPAWELAMTGYLFGSLIQNQLLENILFGIAIRYILDAPNCPPETNLFKFGLQALGQFELRLTKCVHFNMSRISALDARYVSMAQLSGMETTIEEWLEREIRGTHLSNYMWKKGRSEVA
ncbi:hypothetical protein C0995_001992, partial [Termitomyces sp. Mi166